MSVFSRITSAVRALLGYSAGDPTGPDKNWKPKNESEDAILKRERRLLVSRTRDLIRNNPYIAGALECVVNNVLGGGVFPQCRLKNKAGEPDKKLNSTCEQVFRDWAAQAGYVEACELALRHLWQDGELLAHWYLDSSLLDMGLPPLRFEMLEADHLDSTVDGQLPGVNYARQGIEFSPLRSAPVAYHLLTAHPGDSGFHPHKTVRIPAEHITHIFKRRRISQTRGTSWLAPAVPLLRDLGDYQHSERLAARAGAAYGILATQEAGMGDVAGTVNPVDLTDPNRQAEELKGPKITYLPPGVNISTFTNQRPSGAYEPFTRVCLRAVAAALGMSYEAFSKDYTGASYSSARSAAMDERKAYECQQNFISREWMAEVWRRFSALLPLAGVAAPERVPVVWQFPGWQWVDPVKDAQSARIAVEMGLTTHRKLAAKRGEDFDDNVDALAEERNAMKQNGLLPETEA